MVKAMRQFRPPFHLERSECCYSSQRGPTLTQNVKVQLIDALAYSIHAIRESINTGLYSKR